jgi:hypothetical protein
VTALVETLEGWRRMESSPSSYTDAIKAGSRLDGIGARNVRLVEVVGKRRPPSKPRPRPPVAASEQMDMFKRRRKR